MSEKPTTIKEEISDIRAAMKRIEQSALYAPSFSPKPIDPHEDGITITTIDHPKASFWNRIKSIFVRPKFTASNLEPAEIVVVPGDPTFTKESLRKAEQLYAAQFPAKGMTIGKDADYVDADGKNYERISHSHCWDQKGAPACGLDLKDHSQCCLCDLPYKI